MKTEYFRKRLEEEKAKLESEMGHIGRRNPAVPNDWEPVPTETGAESDLIDQAGSILSHENNVAILADLEARYDTVLAALSKIGTKEYGRCVACGKAVQQERLEADPAAQTCSEHLS